MISANRLFIKILAIEHELPGASLDTFKLHMKSEAMQAWELHQSGVIRELYFRQDRNEAVLLLEAPSVGEAKNTLDTLPLVKAGLITFELIPLKAYPGFAGCSADDRGLVRYERIERAGKSIDSPLAFACARGRPLAAGFIEAFTRYRDAR